MRREAELFELCFRPRGIERFHRIARLDLGCLVVGLPNKKAGPDLDELTSHEHRTQLGGGKLTGQGADKGLAL